MALIKNGEHVIKSQDQDRGTECSDVEELFNCPTTNLFLMFPFSFLLEHSNPDSKGLCQSHGEEHSCEEVQSGCHQEQRPCRSGEGHDSLRIEFTF